MAEEKRVRLRAMETIRRQSVDQSEQTTGIHARWIVPGAGSAVFTTTRERADSLIASGHAVELGPDMRKAAKKKPPPKDDKPKEMALPLDFPYRTQLVAAGLKTTDAVATYPDLTQISGIGEAYAERIKKALIDLDGQSED